jgi:pre-mRNA-splicing factor SYF2
MMPPKKAKRINQPLQDPILKDPPKEETNGPPKDDNKAQDDTASESASARAERFKGLRAKLAASTKANHADVIAEHKRMKVNPVQITKIERKKAEAELKLAKFDAEETGDDFERKRAWDWTIEESLAWDRRNEGKQINRDEAGFAGNIPFFVGCLL